jgi:OmcA/MtrC family decaheme c-type cytochrome
MKCPPCLTDTPATTYLTTLQNHFKKGRPALFCAAMMLGAILLFGCSDSGGSGPPGPAGPAGPTGPSIPPAATTSETCSVCHSEGKIADIAVAHPDPTGQNVTISIFNLTNAGGIPVVSFSAATDAGPVTDLAIGDLQFMMADKVPAGTTTMSWGTWDTDYFERWARERVSSSDPVGVLDTTNAANGNYTYTFATGFGSPGAREVAPDYDPAHTQRLFIVLRGGNHVDTSGDVVTNNSVGFLDFVVPAVGAAAAELVSQRLFVTADACKKCHGAPFQQAAHASTYLDTRACVICHSPLGVYGDIMQEDNAYLPVLVHQIHAAIDNPAFEEEIRGLGFGAVTYPQEIADCVACHSNPSDLNLGTGDQIDHWKTSPSTDVCGSCHTNVDFATGENHAGGPQMNNDFCIACHKPTGAPNPPVGANVTDAHDTAPDAVYHPTPENIPEFKVNLDITKPINGSYYTAGEAPQVRVTLTDYATGIAVPSAVYTTPQGDAGVKGGGLNVASVYVYGPRARSVPVLATGTITDPAFDSETDTPTQGHDLFVGGTDPLVTTDDGGFGYQLLKIPADMTAGTYMVRVRIGDKGRISDSNYRIESIAFTNIQIGTATAEEKVAGNPPYEPDMTTVAPFPDSSTCVDCHGTGTAPFHDARHAVVFDTDQCLACHDQSGNFAIPIANRVHAVHSANPEGDIYVINGGSISSRDWSDVTYPQNIQSPVTGHVADDGLPRCVGCHASGDVTYKTLPYMAPCVGCHANGANTINNMPDIDHMRQNGGPY